MPEVEQSMKVEKVDVKVDGGKEEEMTVQEETEEVSVEGEAEDPSDEWLDVLGSGGLKKKVIRAGIVDSRPVKSNTVYVQAIGKTEDGLEVDKHTELIFTVGDSEVIVGLDMIVPLMDKGELAEVYMDSRFAFGEKGLPPSVPANANLIYKVELLDFAPEEDPGEMPISKRMIVGNRKRERGNWWFNRQEYSMAIQCYNNAVDFLDDATEEYGDDINPEVHDILEERLKALNNMGAAQIKLQAYEVALKSFDTVLKCQPNNVKALFRKGKVLGCQGKHKEAMELLKRALELEPEARTIHQELAKIREKCRQEAESEKSLYRRMLGLKKEVTQGDERYYKLKGFPFKTWLTIFATLLVLISAFQYRDDIIRVFT